MVCPNCGNQVPRDALFCDSCGARLSPASKPAAPAPTYSAPVSDPPKFTPPSLPADYSQIAKAQNIRSVISPYMKWKYEAEDEEAQKLLDEYLALNEKYMAEFEASTDKKQWYKDHRKEMKANEVLTKQLDLTDNRTGIAYKYSDFFMENYSSDF